MAIRESAKCFSVLLLGCTLIIVAEARARTVQSEIDALRVIANSLGVSWNFSVDPCSGLEKWNDTAQVDSSGNTDSSAAASGVKCSCNYDRNTTCHVLELKVVNQDKQGKIPPEIGNFTQLTQLNLGLNILTGTLPEEIGKLVNMQYMAIGHNRLSGTIPPQIGYLTSLIGLGIGTNNFSGSMPKEFGNLGNLTSLYMDSSGVGGEIPAEWSNLHKLELWHGYGNNFTGSIPDIFEQMANVKDLRLYGNNFEGPIPFSLWNLTKLEKLYLGDMSSNSTIPSSIANLKSLTELSIRNSGLTGTLPVQLGSLENLTYLDLSFNRISGSIPTALGSLASLETLYLGNNSLEGQFPTELENLSNLVRLDVSYNHLSGMLPRWINNSRLHTNLVWNFFNITSSRLASAEFNCLDGKSPCTRSTIGNNNNFGVNCGGPKTGAFDEDTEDLQGSNFIKSPAGTWAVSSSGWEDGFQEFVQTARQITGGTEVHQSARCSPDSLRYYGLNMSNGNYDVELHFAEISIDSDTTKWKSDGKRIFDIYIQDTKVFAEYNIMDKANGSFKAWVEKIKTYVNNNVLEIHLKWSGKGTCCTPSPHTHGPLISAIYVTSGDVSKHSPSKNTAKVAAIISPLVLLLLIAFISLCFWWHQRKYKLNDEDLKSIEKTTNLYTYNEIKVATNGFHPSNKLGEGGFGVVHKGLLPDGTIIAVKQLSSKFSQHEFVNEVAIISVVQHRNLVKLLGCCYEGEHRILVFEFVESNSLHHCLLGAQEFRTEINWPARFNICKGVACGLAYLHEETLPRIIHRDIKASNILLDKKLNAKIADFGLAKLFKEEQSHISTRVAGTIGYLSPEYAMRGQLTEKADVYSFGVLILEILSGRSNLDPQLPPERAYLLDWIWSEFRNGTPLNVVDETLTSHFSEQEAMRIIKVALLCIQPSPNRRPTMSQVVVMLSGSIEIDVEGLESGYHPDYLQELQLRLPNGNKSQQDLSAQFSPSSTFPAR